MNYSRDHPPQEVSITLDVFITEGGDVRVQVALEITGGQYVIKFTSKCIELNIEHTNVTYLDLKHLISLSQN